MVLAYIPEQEGAETWRKTDERLGITQILCHGLTMDKLFIVSNPMFPHLLLNKCLVRDHRKLLQTDTIFSLN